MGRKMARGEMFFRSFALSNILIIAIVAVMVILLGSEGVMIYIKEGVSFISTSIWSGARESYGILFALGGSIITSIIAIIIALAIAIGSAVTLSELAPRSMRFFLSSLTDLSASIPTVIYGLWGLYILAPAVGWITREWIPESVRSILGTPGSIGTSLLTASILLSIMISPFATAMIREALSSVPRSIDEALYSLGLTRFEVVVLKLRYIRRAIATAMMIAYGRAVGETIAVSMVVGNVVNPEFWRILSPGYTISSLIADQYQNAESYNYMVPAIFGTALVLFAIGVMINIYVTLITRGQRL